MKLTLTKKQISIVAISLLAVVIVTGLTLWGRTEKAQDFVTAKVEKGSIRNTVSATGNSSSRDDSSGGQPGFGYYRGSLCRFQFLP